MVSMQRRFNSTGRARIPRRCVEIWVEEPLDLDSHPIASARIDLDELEFPPSASVELEAYFRSSAMRFPCGTVESITVPEHMELSVIDRGGAVRFRVLVIDSDQSGRIVAAADGLRPARDGKSPDRQSLLPLRETDLGDQLWKIDIDFRTGPTLLINNTVPGLSAQLRSHPLVQGLILPHALRMVLDGLAQTTGDEDEDYWGRDWRKFLDELDLPAEPEDPNDPESVSDWIEQAVDVFCTHKSFASRVKLSGPSGGDDHG